MTWVLLGMIVGCNVCPKGEKAAYTWFLWLEAVFHMNGCTVKDAIMCLAQSILYEKSNNNGYIHGECPAKLGTCFIEDFNKDDPIPELLMVHWSKVCKGCNSKCHVFLMTESTKTAIYVMHCYANSVLWMKMLRDQMGACDICVSNACKMQYWVVLVNMKKKCNSS